MLRTEMRNPATKHIDKMDTAAMLKMISQENRNAVEAVDAAIGEIAQAVELIVAALNKGNRLFYIGAGTSGRLAVVDAAECPPTYGVAPETVTAILAGGVKCMLRASENEEDNAAAGARDLAANHAKAGDVVLGISAAGGAAYVLGALEKARELGCTTISLACNPGCPLEKAADVAICTDTGPEVIAGSTRMKAGTAQKLVLNMLSTCAMVRTGKVYENLMINLKPTNEKLKRRMISIVMEITGMNAQDAEQALEQSAWSIREVVERAEIICAGAQ